MNYLYAIAPDLLIYLAIAAGFNILLFIPAFVFKTDKLTDISYSLSFIFLATVAFFREGQGYFGEFLLFLMIIIWAVRLGGYLLYRIHKMNKDARFDKIRNSFVKFLFFWLIQGVTVWIVMIPSLLFFISRNLIGNNGMKIALMFLGFVIWLAGFVTETLADKQKFEYILKAKNENKPRHWVDVGLWKSSRHPNYFGEILVWVGIYMLIITRVTMASSILALVGPVFIFVVIRFFSGVPILERKANEKYGDDPAYLEYKNSTNLIVPGI